MNLEQIGLMSNEGMYVGSHSFSHRWLDKLNLMSKIKKSICQLIFLKKLMLQLKTG